MIKAKRYCIFCFNNDKLSNAYFFCLPKDRERRQKWLTLTDREDLLDKKNKSYYLCSAHFDDSAMVTQKHLKKDAIPTKNLYKQPSERNDTVSSNELNERFEPCTETQTNSNGKRRNTIIGTQTLPGVSLNLREGKIKRNLEEQLRESNLKRQRLDKEITESKKELEGNGPDDEIGRRFKKIIDWQVKLKNKFKNNRYERELKVFALNLYYSSPYAYRCLQTLLNLPCKSTLCKLKINISPNLDKQILDSLPLKIKSMPETAKYCTIGVNEITLRRNLHYNINMDEIIGFHNINGETSTDIASNAIVIMLQSIYFNWQQPIAYAFVASANHHKEIDLFINDIITKLSEKGIEVKALISDQGFNFDIYAKEFKKVTAEKPYFIHNDKKIYYIFDVPHLMKCVRNNLLTSDFLYDGNKISWDYIDQLYKDQVDRNLRLIPKISDAHIHPNNLQKTRAKLAVQILSRTVSSALDTYIDLGKISEDARPTAAFLELMNNLFDILNSNKIKCSNIFQTAFRLSKDQENILNAALKMFSATTAINRKSGNSDTEPIKSFMNFQISIQSIKMLYEDLEADGNNYLLTRRLNMDNFNKLGSIRQEGKYCSEPTPIKFKQAFSKLVVCNMLKNSATSDCKMDIYDVLLKAEDIIKSSHKNTVIRKPPVCLMGETDYRMDLPPENTMTYVSAYLFFKCMEKHMCSVLNEVLLSIPDLSETVLYDGFKDYNKELSFYGKLKLPPEEFLEYIQDLETTFMQHFDDLITTNIGGKLLKLLKAVTPQAPCSCFPVHFLLKLFTRFRIFVNLKFNNLQFKTKQIKVGKSFSFKCKQLIKGIIIQTY